MDITTTAICCEEGCNKTFGIIGTDYPGIAIVMCNDCYKKKISTLKTAFRLSLESRLKKQYFPE